METSRSSVLPITSTFRFCHLAGFVPSKWLPRSYKPLNYDVLIKLELYFCCVLPVCFTYQIQVMIHVKFHVSKQKILTWRLIGWRHSRQPIRSQFWRFLLTRILTWNSLSEKCPCLDRWIGQLCGYIARGQLVTSVTTTAPASWIDDMFHECSIFSGMIRATPKWTRIFPLGAYFVWYCTRSLFNNQFCGFDALKDLMWRRIFPYWNYSCM